MRWVKNIWLMITIVWLTGCPGPEKKIDYDTLLSLECAGPTFMGLYLAISDEGSLRSYSILRDDVEVLQGNLFGADTIITDWNVTVNSTHTYQLIVYDGDRIAGKSDPLELNSMPATSHDFIWEVDYLGYPGILHDAWIFDENNAMVVGQYDKTWGGSENYLMAKWDGQQWTDGYISYAWNECRFIHAFNENDIWTASGAGAAHYFDNKWLLTDSIGTAYPTDFRQIMSGWGPEPSTIFFGAREGRLLHYENGYFTELEKITDKDLRYMDGSVDSRTGDIRIFAGGFGYPDNGSLIHYTEAKWSLIFGYNVNYYPQHDGNQFLETLGIFCPDSYYATFLTAGLREMSIAIHNQTYFDDYKQSFVGEEFSGNPGNIHGTDHNDWFYVANRKIIHYNGESFQFYPEISQSFGLFSVFQKGDFVLIVGQDYNTNNAIVIRGYRRYGIATKKCTPKEVMLPFS